MTDKEKLDEAIDEIEFEDEKDEKEPTDDGEIE
jgi:hypothetical protein